MAKPSKIATKYARIFWSKDRLPGGIEILLDAAIREASKPLVDAVLEAAEGGYYQGLSWDGIVAEARKLRGA